jgi:hypothetical protein
MAMTGIEMQPDLSSARTHSLSCRLFVLFLFRFVFFQEEEEEDRQKKRNS